ncbi:PREDICTED: histone-lysine N-methyltransferase SMYD3 isoform X2 [Nicrophorus vespilloides]|uniref:Histone-lysine N-methyltransferase SMYD3 isoform X2 n=1 Tax=Nicrophorus vespilloides TaxID=110193 RepID=A0ABM1M688_NICVS|nr:PREDICTED: histone-lysine N-methyltransferase SMYD3 isoform X2 [Nicrophorus vespilloides]
MSLLTDPVCGMNEMRVLQRVKPGTVLIKEEPFVYILSSKVHSQYCDNCFKKGKLLKCSNCQYVYYCGRDCQREAWSVHKPECSNIKRTLPRVLPDAARLLARLIRKLQKGGDLVKSYYSEGNFRMFKDLMSHYTDLKENSKKMEHFVSLYGVLHEFFGGVGLPNSAELMGMYGRMCVNSFNICDSELVSLGTGIYLGASIVDHSCKPNAVATFEGVTLSIRCTEELPSLDWSQIFISYIDTMNTPKVRQEDLMYTYYFLCQCPKCLDPKETDNMIAAACPNTNCDASIDPMQSTEKCLQCNEKITEDFLKKYKEITEFSDVHLKNMHDMAYMDVCKFCLQKQRGVLHKFNVQYVKTLDLAFQACIDFGQWNDAREFGEELIEGYKIYFGDVHPLLGLLYLKLGKILVYQEECRQALVHLKKAKDVLSITHGSTSKLFRNELIPLLQQALAETGLDN